MVESFKQLDRILRGQATRPAALREGFIDVAPKDLALVLVALGMVYGLCMGLFSVIASKWANYAQMGATIVKVPLLFVLTLLVTFPSLYVFNALVGSRLTIGSLLRLLLAAMGVMLAVLASFGTIVAFFSVSTDSYNFMKLLNVAVFAISGFLGLGFLLQTLHRLTIAQEERSIEAPPVMEGAAGSEPPALPARGALDPVEGRVISRNVRTVFRMWIVVFGLVGAQMAWVLRPFIGRPDAPFSIFRERRSNFFQAVWDALRGVLGG